MTVQHYYQSRSPSEIVAHTLPIDTMSATATTSTWKSASSPHSHSRSHSRTSRPSTTPRSQPHATSKGQAMPPFLSPEDRANVSPKDGKTSSPSYFGLVSNGAEESIPPDSNPGYHARQNWQFSSSAGSGGKNSPTSRHVPMEIHPDFAAFRRQSEKNGFMLAQNLSGLDRPFQSRTTSETATMNKADKGKSNSSAMKRPHLDRSLTSSEVLVSKSKRPNNQSFFEFPRNESPASMTPRHSVAEHENARLSLPVNELKLSPAKNAIRNQRAETVPVPSDKSTPPMMAPNVLTELLQQHSDILLLDLRVYQQYAQSRIQGALNLCIPTTLLKRPSFTVQKLADTFASDHDRELFNTWRDCSYIVVYDLNSALVKDAVTPLNVLKKFTSEGWTGQGVVIRGGFQAFSKQIPDLIDRGQTNSKLGSPSQMLSIAPPAPDAVPVAGGCSMPSAKSAANPFFGTIRQNMDLIDGVGQMPIQKPSDMSERGEGALPLWIQEAASTADEGKLVSGRFLSLERSEQSRMQQALNTKVSYGTPRPHDGPHIQIAGIEKGTKNRYNNIFPYDHSRVRLQNVPNGGCDYVNASFVQAEYSNRHYIATQAPIPATFNDFWRVVWEQDVRVIVMLTAESEGGQVKSHTYWNPGEYGPLKLKKLSERRVQLDPQGHDQSPVSNSRRPSLGQRRSTTNDVSDYFPGDNVKSPVSEPSIVQVRHFTLSHSALPFQPMREITQLHFSQWPDFGAPASPTTLLGLIEQVNKYVRSSAKPEEAISPQEAAPKGERPVVVHCSAGCGRTGTFCTIDSVIDMLKRQRLERAGGDGDDDDGRMELDSTDNWIQRDDVDLIAKTVDDFRHQRLSMVQNLRQFVLCYESVLQWLVGQQSDSIKWGSEAFRRSFHG